MVAVWTLRGRWSDAALAELRAGLASRRRASSEFTAQGLIHHSDAGSQYTALAFTEELAEAGLAGSIGTVGEALDNALMESTIGLFKTECITLPVRRRNWAGLRDVERETAEWVRWYNTERIHSSIDYMTPIERELVYVHTIARPAAPAWGGTHGCRGSSTVDWLSMDLSLKTCLRGAASAAHAAAAAGETGLYALAGFEQQSFNPPGGRIVFAQGRAPPMRPRAARLSSRFTPVSP
jgi:Integrase core domain